MKIRIAVINDHKFPNELMKAVESRTLWITEADDIYDKLLKVLDKELKELEDAKKTK